MTSRHLSDMARHGSPLSRAESRRRAKILGLLRAGQPIASGASVSVTEILADVAPSSATSRTATFSAGANIGDCVILMLAHDTAGSRPAGPISDSAGNSYTKGASTDTGWTTGALTYYVCASLTAAIVGGATTITWTTGAASNKVTKAVCLSGVHAVSVDKTNNKSTQSTATPNTNTTGTLGQATEAVFAAYGYDCSGGTPTFTQPTGHSQTTTTQQVAHGGLVAISTSYQLVSATTALNPAATLSTSQNDGAAILTLKYTVGGVPVNTVAPSVTGTTTLGQTLTCTSVRATDWTDDGTGVLTYQWARETAGGSGVYTNIAAATSSTYALVNADVGLRVRCDVTDTDGVGATLAHSNAVGPVNEWAPKILGYYAQ